MVVIGDKKVSQFVKFEIIPHLLCCSLLKGIEFYDKFEDIFFDQSKGKNPVFTKRKCFGEYDAVALTMSFLKVVHGMVPSWNNDSVGHV